MSEKQLEDRIIDLDRRFRIFSDSTTQALKTIAEQVRVLISSSKNKTVVIQPGPVVPEPAGNNDKILTVRGGNMRWEPAPSGSGTASSTVTSETTFGASSGAGAATTYSRGDHTHGTPADPVPTHDGLATAHAAATNLEKTANKGAANGYASLNASTQVVEAILRLISGTGSLTATEGYLGWQSTAKYLRLYDATRERSIGDRGWLPFAYPTPFVATAALTTAASLVANGGSIAIPMWLDGHMLLESVSVRNTDTATARTWGWDLYEQYQNSGSAGENTLTRVAASNANETFTPSAASTRTITAGSAPIYLGPGLYWLVVQSRHATSTFGLASTAASSAFNLNTAQTKTTTNPNGSTLDFVAATWTKVTAVYAVRLNGRVFGQSTSF